MILPAHNAHLTGVYRRGATVDFDLAEGAAASKWQGDCEAWVSERTYENVAGGELEVVTETTLKVPANLPVDVDPEDLVTYVPDRGLATTRRVRQVEGPEPFTIRLRLWNT